MNEDNRKKLNIKDRILQEIRAGDVAMTPKIYFTLRFVATLVTALAVLVVTVFIVNFILFSIRIESHDALLSFGPQGISAFLAFFPWHLLVLDVGLIALLQYLLRQFRLGYKVPMLYAISGLVAGAFAWGLLLDRGTPLNEFLMVRTRHLPSPIGEMYEHAMRPLPPGSGICRCTILEIDGNILTVEDTRDATSTLRVILPDADDRATTTDLEVGDLIFIAGEEHEGIIEAFGVRRVMPHVRMFIEESGQ